MFKKLHRKLTFTNAIILICFLLTFSYSIVRISSLALDRSAENSLREKTFEIMRISKELDSFNFVMEAQKTPNGNILRDITSIYFVIWGSDQKISAISIVDEELIGELFKESKDIFDQKNNQFKLVKANGLSYRMYSQYYELPSGKGGVIQVFQSREIDLYILNQLFFVIISIGSVSIFILILISSYMAKKSLEPVRMAYERQKEFVADASHELRTPLTIMRTNLELLSMKEDETIKENEKWFNYIFSETETMTKLVQNLLVLAQVDHNQIKSNVEYLDLTELTKKICGKLTLVASEKHIHLKSVISDNVMVKGDANRLEQLFVILIDNAIKYTPEGGSIVISLMTTTDKVYLSVKDTGVGISESDKDKIFGRFYRADKVRSREQGGAGLGLSIAKWIVDDHKGTIQLKSNLGEGSEFIIGLNKKNKNPNRL